MDLTPFTKAGLRQTEISELVGVNRVTAWQWMSRKREPHSLLTGKLVPLLHAVSTAVEDGSLPLASHTPREHRLREIKAIVGERMKSRA